jgi:hypothetical protein
MSSVPIGRLRGKSDWAKNRPLGTLPFLLAGGEVKWAKHAVFLGMILKVESIYALLPARRLWYTPFSEWTDQDWSDPGHLSLLWKIKTGRVLAHVGIVDIKTTRTRGVPFTEYAAAQLG